MLETVRRAFQIEDIRKRLFYTFLMLVVVRLGSQLPTPGVDPTYIQEFFANQTGDAFNFFDAFTGGSFTQMSVFALSITPVSYTHLNKNVEISARNIKDVKTAHTNTINVFDILKYNTVITTKAAVATIEEVYA